MILLHIHISHVSKVKNIFYKQEKIWKSQIWKMMGLMNYTEILIFLFIVTRLYLLTSILLFTATAVSSDCLMNWMPDRNEGKEMAKWKGCIR
jgi:hypothetical protein